MVMMSRNPASRSSRTPTFSMDQDNSNMSSDSYSNSSNNRKRSHGDVDKDSQRYREKRQRNNLAVKKSRQKSKEKTKATLEKVNALKAENEALEAKIQLLTKELTFLKDLFLAHAGSAHGLQNLDNLDLSMFAETNEPSPTEDKITSPSNRERPSTSGRNRR